MYTVSDACRTALQAHTRTDRLTGTLTLTDGTMLSFGAGDLMSGSVTIDNQCVSGQELEFGCVYMGQAAFQLRTAMSRYRLYGAKVTLTYAILAGEGWYSIPLGVYTVAEAERSTVSVSLKAYDNMLALCGSYSGVALQGTPYEMLCQIADSCGLAVGCTEEELAAMPNGRTLFQLDASDGCETWRDCLSALAQVVGGFGTVDRSGALVLRSFAAAPSLALPASLRSSLALSDFRCHYCGVTGGGAGAYTEGDAGLVLALDNAPLLEKGLEERRQAILDALLPVLAAADYVPATVHLPGDPTIDPGDRLSLPDRDAETLVTHLVWKFRGQATVKGVGKNPYLSGGTSQEQRALHQLQTQTENQKTVYYSFTNSRALTAAPGSEVILGSVLFAPTRQTSVLFLAQLLLEVTADGETGTVPTVTVRYYLNGARMDYQPVQAVGSGPWSLALILPLTGLSGNTLYSWSVRLLTSGCTATAAKGALQATISGQNLAGTAPWDGTIDEEDHLPAVTLGLTQLRARALSGEAAAGAQRPGASGAADQLSAVTLGAGLLRVQPLAGTPAVNDIVTGWTLDTGSDASYAADWVTTENGVFALRRQYTAVSAPCAIDSGLCMALPVDTACFKSVERIEVI